MSYTKEQRIVNQAKPNAINVQAVPIMNDMILPNHSGDHSKGRVLATPTTDYEIANKKYVDDSIAAITPVIDRTSIIFTRLQAAAAAYLFMNNVQTSSARGFYARRSGSVVSLSGFYTISSYAAGGDVEFNIRKNGNIIYTLAAPVTGNVSDASVTFIQAAGIDTFVAGDRLTVDVTLEAGAGFNISAVIMNLEVEYD